MKLKYKWEDCAGTLLLVISMIFLGISVFLCFSNDIWYDELFTMGLGNQSFREMIAITAADVHPPLYYMVVKLFLMTVEAAGLHINQAAIAKLVSVLPFLFCFLYAVFKIRKHFGLMCAGLTMFLVSSMPQLPAYTVEVRMYGYAMFFILAGMLHAFELTGMIGKVYENKKQKNQYYVNWAWVTIYSLAACYTHYFACVAAVMIYVYLLLYFIINRIGKQGMKPFAVSGAVCAAGYLPWLITVVSNQLEQVKENYWIQPLTWKSIGGCIKFLFQPAFSHDILNIVMAVLLFAVFVAVVLYGIIRMVKQGNEEEKSKGLFSIGCLFILAGIVIFGFAASFFIRPIFVYRYMLPAAGVFWLSFSVCFSSGIKSRQVWIPVLVLFLIVGVRNYRAFYGEEMWKRLQMRTAEQALSEIKEADKVIFNFDQTQAVVTYYTKKDSYLWAGTPETLIKKMYPENHELVPGEFEDEAGMKQIKGWLEAGEAVWYLGSGNVREEIIDKWKAAGIDVKEHSSVMIEKYWFNIYFLSKESPDKFVLRQN